LTEKNIISNLKFAIIVAFIVFFVCGNKAWLNPALSKNTKVIKTLDSVPLFWQYNPDAVQFLMGATYFPHFFKTHPKMLSRPVYPILANLSGKVLGFITNPFIKLSPLYLTGAGWLIMKFILYIAGVLALLSIYNRYLPENFAKLSTILVFFYILPLYHAGEFHTFDTHTLTPIFLIFFFLKLKDNYSHKYNFIFSFIVGIIILTKEIYACYLALLLFSVYHRKFLPALLSFAFHTVPYFLYHWFLTFHNLSLQYLGSSLKDHDGQGRGFVTWYLGFMNENGLIASFSILLRVIQEILISFFSFYSILCILIFGGLLIAFNKKLYSQEIIFAGILFATTCLQMFATHLTISNSWYLPADCSVVFLGFATLFLKIMLEKWDFTRFSKNIMVALGCVWLIINISKMVHLPWVHPYDQNLQVFKKSAGEVDAEYR
jgi:hypothetical protein